MLDFQDFRSLEVGRQSLSMTPPILSCRSSSKANAFAETSISGPFLSMFSAYHFWPASVIRQQSPFTFKARLFFSSRRKELRTSFLSSS